MSKIHDVIDREASEDLCTLMERKYATFLNDRKFMIKSEADATAVYVTVTLSNADQSYYYPVESRLHFAEFEMEQQQAALFLVDFIDLYFEGYLTESDEEIYIPIDWTDFTYDAVTLQLRGQIINLKAEKIANDLLEAAAANIIPKH